MNDEKHPSENATDLTKPPDTAHTIGGWMIALAWIIFLAVGALFAQNWLDKRDKARQGTWVSGENGAQSLLLKANRYGQYQLLGSANGQDVMFLVDTGASGISIPANIATDLGLRRGRPFQVATANGITTVYATSLATLGVGPLLRQDVEAHINPSMNGNVALLGMNFLRHYELVQRDGELTISDL